MKRFIKIFLYSLLALAMLLIVAIIALPMIIDPNDYKDQIITLVKDKTGRDLELTGKIELSLFPWLGFTLGEMQLHNPPGFKDTTFVKIEHAKARIKLLSIFSDPIEIGQLELHGLQVHLQKNSHGLTNWEDLIKPKADSAKTPEQQAPTSDKQPAVKRKRVTIEGVQLQDASLVWDDHQSQQHLVITGIQLQAGPLKDQQAFPLQLQMAFSKIEPALQGTLALQGNVSLNPEQQQYQFSAVQLDALLKGPTLPKGQAKLQLQTPQLHIDLRQQQVMIKNFALDVDDIKASGHVEVASFAQPQIRFGLDISALNLNPYLPKPAAGKTAPPTTPKAEPIKLALPADLNIQGTLNINELQVQRFNLSKISVPLSVKDQRLHLQPSLHLYEGEYHGDLQLNAQVQPLRLIMQHELRGVAFAPLVQAITDKDVVSGKAELDAKLTTQGLSMEAWVKSLNGDARLRITQVQLKNLELKSWILGRWYEKLNLAKPKEELKDLTVFNDVRASLQIQNGIVSNKDLLATSERVQLTGQGQVNLVAENIDYTVNYIPKTSYVFSLAGNEVDLKDEPIPIQIHGAFAGPPKTTVEIMETIKRIQKRSLDKKVDAKKEEIKKSLDEQKDKLKDKLNDKLKDFLKR
jgi:AsmA protein